MKKIKVLQIISSAKIGGAEKSFCSLLKYLDKGKFEIYVGCPPSGPMIKDFKKYAAEIKPIKFNNWRIPLEVFSLKKYIKRKKIDIVHTQLVNADLVGIIAAKLAGVPCKISTIQGYNFSGTGIADLRSIKNFFFSFIYRIMYIFYDQVIAVCVALKRDLVERPGIKVEEEKISVIYNTIDMEEMVSAKQNTPPANTRIFDKTGIKFVGTIANFDRVKGHRILLRAIVEVLKNDDKVKFILAGDGEEKRYIERTARKLKIEDKIICVGILEDASHIISICDMVVIPSLSEGCPLVVIEAMYLGKPVVATRVGGVPELIEENETGLMVSRNDYKGLSRAIKMLLDNSDLAVKMGHKGKEVIRGKLQFNAREMTKHVERLYLRSLGIGHLNLK